MAGVLVLASALRVWGIRHGLPFVYNPDEFSHFVPKAIDFFGGDYNPHDFRNPPAFAYVLHAVFAVWFGGGDGAVAAWGAEESDVYVVGRLTAAALGTVSVWLVYLTGARLFDRWVGLLAAGLLAVAFLPVSFAHQALNDAPALAPLALGLFGAAGVARRGRLQDYALAGTGIGLAAATKYTSGIVAIAVVGAVAAHASASPERRRVLGGFALAGAAALGTFVLANPYAVLDFDTFRAQLEYMSSANRVEKLGLEDENGLRYYLWTFTWGLGWAPSVAALAGSVLLLIQDRRAALVLVSGPIAFLVFMGAFTPYGRYLLPTFPFVCLLAAYAGVRAARTAGRTLPRLVPAFALLAVAALAVEGLVHSVHLDRVLTRADTRELTRAWMREHIPSGAAVALEPVMPTQHFHDPGALPVDRQWSLVWPRRVARGESPLRARRVRSETYVRYLKPELVDAYAREGVCWVVSGSSESGRAFAEPNRVPAAIAYYEALARRARVVYRASPYDPGAGPVPYNFDWATGYFPLAYGRPGPEMVIYRLVEPACS